MDIILIPNLIFPVDAILAPTLSSNPSYLITSRNCLELSGYTTELTSNDPSKVAVSTVSVPPVLSVTAASFLRNAPAGCAVFVDV